MSVPDNIVWRDGLAFHWPSELRKRAWEIKYGDRPDAVEAAIEAVDQHWREKTVLTTFGERSWEEAHIAWGQEDDRYPTEYESQAQLAHDVLYAVLRAPLLALIFEQYAEGEGRAPKVFAVDDAGAVEYSGRGKRRVTLEEMLSYGEEE